MDDTHPFIGVAVAIVMLAFGLVAVGVPGKIRQMAARSYQQATWSRKIPFAYFANSQLYEPGLRVMGLVWIVAGVLLLVVSLLAIRQSS